MNSESQVRQSFKSQNGAMMPLIAVMMTALVGMAALTIDGGHVYSERNQLQNALDMAALTGAKVLDVTADVDKAKAAAKDEFAKVLLLAGNAELNQGIVLAVATANTLSPFGGDVNPRFLRVSLESPIILKSSLSSVFGINEFKFDSTAVAGPSNIIPSSCDLAPIVLCGDPAQPDNLWGYGGGAIDNLALASATGATIGPGNFQLFRIVDPGVDVVKKKLAGDGETCGQAGDSSTFQTQPGNVQNAIDDGLSTRFGVYQGGLSEALYPSDVITTPQASYAAYQVALATPSSWDKPAGKPQRRLLSVVVATCTGDANGTANLQVLGAMCVFLRQDPTFAAGKVTVPAEALAKCTINNGRAGADSGATNGSYKIILHDDPNRAQS